MLLSFIRSKRWVALSHKREMPAHQHLIGNVFYENTCNDADMAIYRYYHVEEVCCVGYLGHPFGKLVNLWEKISMVSTRVNGQFSISSCLKRRKISIPRAYFLSKVGGRRGPLLALFRPPPSEPFLHLSAHTALQLMTATQVQVHTHPVPFFLSTVTHLSPFPVSQALP